jgi:phosphoglycerate dehydrogenase-like enzyme
VFTRNLGPDEAAAALQGFDAICLLRERMPVPASLIAALPDLKLIAITGAQNRTLDLAAAHARGIVVSRTERSGNADFATAELAWGLILSALRHIPREAAGMRAGAWQTTLGEGLAGLTLGLVGLGRLGRRMVPVAKAFGMDVIAWSQNLTAEAAETAGARRVEKAALFREADVISLHLVLSERTRGVVGAAELGLMRPHALLVNTSRGPLIDGPALVEALRARRIGGAALDVYDTEPLPADDPLRGLDNALLTPHLGYVVRERMRDFYEETAENVAAFLDGRPIRTLKPA